MESSDDWMLYVVLQHEKKKKLHSVVKESRKFKFQLHTELEENGLNVTATEAVKEIKQKPKQACQKDMKRPGEINFCMEDIQKGHTMVM